MCMMRAAAHQNVQEASALAAQRAAGQAEQWRSPKSQAPYRATDLSKPIDEWDVTSPPAGDRVTSLIPVQLYGAVIGPE